MKLLPGGATVTAMLRPLGFFRELRHGRPDSASLKDSVRSIPGPDEREATGYLRSGSALAVTTSTVSDVLSGDTSPIARLEVLTDGVWLWPADLPYYLERYHVPLPHDFVEHARSRGWLVPKLSREELVALEHLQPPV